MDYTALKHLAELQKYVTADCDIINRFYIQHYTIIN
jgi:hypothetical protein